MSDLGLLTVRMLLQSAQPLKELPVKPPSVLETQIQPAEDGPYVEVTPPECTHPDWSPRVIHSESSLQVRRDGSIAQTSVVTYVYQPIRYDSRVIAAPEVSSTLAAPVSRDEDLYVSRITGEHN